MLIELLLTEGRRSIAPFAGCTDATPSVVLVHHVLGADHGGRVAALDIPEITLALEGDDDFRVAHGPTISCHDLICTTGQFGLTHHDVNGEKPAAAARPVLGARRAPTRN
jgi:hypothetical protein